MWLTLPLERLVSEAFVSYIYILYLYLYLYFDLCSHQWAEAQHSNKNMGKRVLSFEKLGARLDCRSFHTFTLSATGINLPLPPPLSLLSSILLSVQLFNCLYVNILSPQSTWYGIYRIMMHPHQWVRLSCARLLGLHLSKRNLEKSIAKLQQRNSAGINSLLPPLLLPFDSLLYSRCIGGYPLLLLRRLPLHQLRSPPPFHWNHNKTRRTSDKEHCLPRSHFHPVSLLARPLGTRHLFSRPLL